MADEPKKRRTYQRHDKRQFRGISLRTSDELELRLDRLVLALSQPGERLTRGGVARLALEAGLEALEVARRG